MPATGKFSPAVKQRTWSASTGVWQSHRHHDYRTGPGMRPRKILLFSCNCGQHVVVPKANLQVKSNVQMIKEMCKSEKCASARNVPMISSICLMMIMMIRCVLISKRYLIWKVFWHFIKEKSLDVLQNTSLNTAVYHVRNYFIITVDALHVFIINRWDLSFLNYWN